jgi:hypothetical protein
MRLHKTYLMAILTMSMGYLVHAQTDRVPSGTEIPVRVNDNIDAKSSNEGRIYTGVVERDVRDTHGNVVVPRGSNAELIVRDTSDRSLVLDLESVTANGRRYAVSTTDKVVSADQSDRKEGVGANERTGKYVGGGALIGTIIGAIAGGGKGAAIGAVTGAGAGAAGQTVTRGGEVRVPSESLVTFRLDRPIIVGGPDPGYDRDGYHYHNYNNDNSNFRSRSSDR